MVQQPCPIEVRPAFNQSELKRLSAVHPPIVINLVSYLLFRLDDVVITSLKAEHIGGLVSSSGVIAGARWSTMISAPE